jgi:hypothetical protein
VPRLRPKREAQRFQPAVPEWAICTMEYRPAPVAPLYRQGEKRLVTDPAVQRNPEFWKGLVDLDPEGVN